MKRIPILSLFLTLSTLAGFLFLFPLEWVLLLVTLIALITVQVILVRRHLHVVGNSASRQQSAVGLGKVYRESHAPQVSATAPAEESTSESGEGVPFDPAVFSRFRAHLDAAERGEGAEPPAPEPGNTKLAGTMSAGAETAVPEPSGRAGGQSSASADSGPVSDAAGDGDVRVVISPAAKRKAASTEKTDTTRAAQRNSEDGEKDLFADLRTQPLKAQPLKTPPAKIQPLEDSATGSKPAAKGSKGKAAAKVIGGTVYPGAPAGAGAAAATANQAEAPASKDTGELEMLLKLAEEALEKGDRAGAAAGLEQVQRLQGEMKGPMPWRMRLAQARLAVLEGNHDQAVEDFEELLKWHPRFEETEYVGQIDQLTSSVSGASGAELRVTMLLKLLAVFRQASDRTAMDRIYVLIEKAQEQSGDELRLIQYYKNHLEIKTVLEDVEGQLNLIDQIGNRYYKLGDTEAARKFYEQGLKLREAQEAASEGAGTAPS